MNPYNQHYHHLSPCSFNNNSLLDDTTQYPYTSCSYCKKEAVAASQEQILNPLEIQTLSLTPPLDNIYYYAQEQQPFSCIYLLNLFLAPDMTLYLKESPMSEDIYNLPCLYLQQLVCEARMDAIMSNETTNTEALNKMTKLRSYITHVVADDTEAIISTLNELIHDEDELVNICGG